MVDRAMAGDAAGGLRLPDINALRRDQHSFLARVLSIGADTGQLPPRLEAALGVFLRAQALAVAQRQRTGIALGRDAMRLGLTQAWGCLELGLVMKAGDDVESALTELSTSQLSALHQDGYEEAFRRLQIMQRESALLITSKDVGLCTDLQEDFDRWCNLTPETWVLRVSDGAAETVDPTRDFERFVQTRARLQFIRSFPLTQRQDLRQDVTTTYTELMRRVTIALAIGHHDLNLTAPQVEEARHRVFTPHSADTEQRKELTRLLETHLHGLFKEPTDRAVILQDVSATLACLVEASTDATTFLLTVDQRLGEFVVDDPDAARKDAAEDLRAIESLARQP